MDRTSPIFLGRSRRTGFVIGEAIIDPKTKPSRVRPREKPSLAKVRSPLNPDERQHSRYLGADPRFHPTPRRTKYIHRIDINLSKSQLPKT